MISQGLPIFGRFCRPLRNVVTEAFAEPSEDLGVSPNRILADHTVHGGGSDRLG